MKPFTLHTPSSAEEAVRLLASKPSAQVISGGQTLLLEMKTRRATPENLVSVSAIPDLSAWGVEDDGTLDVGACVTYVTLVKAPLAGWWRELSVAFGGIADRALRNRGTVGGSLCAGEARYDAPTLAVGSDAHVTTVSLDGSGDLAALDFLTRRASAPGEVSILTHVRFPPIDRWQGFAFEKVSQRQFDSAVVSVTVALAVSADRTVREARVAVGALDRVPVLATTVAERLVGLSVDGVPAGAADGIGDEVVPLTESSSRFRRYQQALLPALFRRAATRAFEQARSAT